MYGRLVEIEEILTDPSQLSTSLLDENVNWKLLQKYFTKKLLKQVDAILYLKIRCLCVLLQTHLKLPLV